LFICREKEELILSINYPPKKLPKSKLDAARPANSITAPIIVPATIIPPTMCDLLVASTFFSLISILVKAETGIEK
jgi:hypothetical protein